MGIQVNDIGTVIVQTILDANGAVLNISTASVKQLIFRSPIGIKKTKTASFSTNGADGKIQYTSISGDFDIGGVWYYQGSVVMPSGTWKTNVDSFEVEDNL